MKKSVVWEDGNISIEIIDGESTIKIQHTGTHTRIQVGTILEVICVDTCDTCIKLDNTCITVEDNVLLRRKIVEKIVENLDHLKVKVGEELEKVKTYIKEVLTSSSKEP